MIQRAYLDPMMHRSNNPRTARLAASTDAPAMPLRSLPLVAAAILVLVLITVQPGAGTGFV